MKAAAALLATATALTACAASGDGSSHAETQSVNGTAAKSAGGAGSAVALAAASAPPYFDAIRVIARDGHRSHPTWYHDAQLLERNGVVTATWNGNSSVWAGQFQASDFVPIATQQINSSSLGGGSDSTGTDTNRHDVPAVAADSRGFLHFLYGGGSIAGRQSVEDGPYSRESAQPNAITTLRPERRRKVRGGSAYDFESVVDSAGTTHFFGQRSRSMTGSLIDLRLDSNGNWLPSREIIRGGYYAKGCELKRRPRGCNRFAIARSAIDSASGMISIVWGYSERSLSGKCKTDLGYCNRNLYYAQSADNGVTWKNASGRAAITTPGSRIWHADKRFRLDAGPIALFKAVSPDPNGNLIVYGRPNGKRRIDLYAARMVAGKLKRKVRIASAGDHRVASWNGSLVLRRDPIGFTLWIPTGRRIFRFFSADGSKWQSRIDYRGPAWSLTGAPSGPGRQLLLWRGAQGKSVSQVVLGATRITDRLTPATGD